MANQNPYIPEKKMIIRVFDETHDIKTFRLECKTNHKPGQFMEVSLPGIGECPISIASYSNYYLDLCIRDVGNVTHLINSKRIGDYLWVRGPYGNGYPMDNFKGKDIVMVAGGTGTAPIKGAIEYILKNRKDFGKITVFTGFRHYEDVLFKREMEQWKKLFNYEFTLDCAPEGKNQNLKCNIGVVTALIDKSEISKDAVALMCGPPAMIKFAAQSLMNKGLDEKNVYISFERLMSCGIGKCGHCELGGKYVCKHGPVFSYDKAKDMTD
jgi:anaerobic sulfite reductase subunit B